jgi:hypothetical protein
MKIFKNRVKTYHLRIVKVTTKCASIHYRIEQFRFFLFWWVSPHIQLKSWSGRTYAEYETVEDAKNTVTRFHDSLMKAKLANTEVVEVITIKV